MSAPVHTAVYRRMKTHETLTMNYVYRACTENDQDMRILYVAVCFTRALKVDIDPIIYTQVHVIPSYKNQQWVLSMRINALYWARGTQSQTLCQKLGKNSKFMIQMFKIIVWKIYMYIHLHNDCEIVKTQHFNKFSNMTCKKPLETISTIDV